MTLEILEIKLEMTTNSILLSGIKEKAKKLGFDDVGFCNASVSSAISKNLVQFVKEGWHGEMHWMKKNYESHIYFHQTMQLYYKTSSSYSLHLRHPSLKYPD